jgi:uncharacterized protein YbgA (DUF1722 family)/uncharacterized protein YbbK (DUF523 family)
MEANKPRVGISACLLGRKVRYDGQHKLDHYLVDTLGPFVDWVPICPEVECGLPIPRESMHVEGQGDELRLVTRKSGTDHTPRMQEFIARRLPEVAQERLCGFVFKKSSPTSGLHDAKYYNSAGMPAGRGPGIFAKAFVERFPLLPVEDEGRLHDADIRENFIERIFIMHRWQRMRAAGSSGLAELMAFHAAHKLIVMSHSPQAVKELGRLTADGKGREFDTLCDEYLGILMATLQQQASVSRHVNVLQHIMGYFKHELTSDEKQELLEVIGEYQRGLSPLLVPVTLLRHYVRKYDNEYLLGQLYLKPFPAELMLRNHV